MGVIPLKEGIVAGRKGVAAGGQGIIAGGTALVWRISRLPAIAVCPAYWQAGVDAIPAAFHFKIFGFLNLSANVNKKILETAK